MPSHPPVTRREIVGWAMFDFANSAYTTVIITVAFSIYFTKLVVPGVRADFLWGMAVLLSNLIVVLGAPILGAIADDSGRKKLLLGATWIGCVVSTAALWFVLPGAVGLALVLFVLSNVAYSYGESLAGAFLPEISTPANIGRVSGFGWGLGYMGGLGSLFLVLPLVKPGFDLDNLSNLRLAWVVTGLFFLLGGLPTFLWLRERAPRGPLRSLGGYTREGFVRLANTMRSLSHFRELARFLAVFTLFSAGLGAIISFAAIYAERTVGFDGGEIIGLFLVLQISAGLGAVFFGWLQDRLGAKLTIQISLVLWLAVSAGAWATHTKTAFWVVALASGLGIGSLQSASRALVGLFSPQGKAGEFFGFWGLASRVAYMIGPATFGAISSATGSQRAAVAVNGLFFLLGLAGMTWVDEEAGHRAALEWHGPPAAE
ncbi:MAG: MFS transporter [Thermoanaerobaculia bacterium]